MSRFVAALMTVIGNKVTTSVHPAMLQKLLGDAAPRDVLTARSSRATGDLEQESGIEAVKRAGREAWDKHHGGAS